MAPSWSDLPVDLLPLVLANLPNPADRARSRAVCRAWRSAVSHIERPSLPWVAMWEGEVVTPSDGRSHRLPSFPDNAVCAGSTDDWLLVGLGRKRFFRGGGYAHVNHGYLLHNPFSDTSVPLTTLNSTITNHETCYIRRFLTRSTADDFIAVVTDRMDYSVIVFREGKGVWSPEPKTSPYIDIIDVAFLEDTLYAIDRGENLIPLHLALDDDGKPLVTKGNNNYFNSAEECTRNEETNEEDIITRHLIKSLGKLLLVRRLRRIPSSEMIRGYTRHGYTLQVEVLEADLTIGAWVPLVRLGGGQALFVSQDFSRFVPAPCGEIKEDVMYNLDTGEM
ncbi:hypothetical protein D1007_03590 [Hordeum vulgare]|nr:hypothetical protein D1007_03590 [Hordeum vulgare]